MTTHSYVFNCKTKTQCINVAQQSNINLQQQADVFHCCRLSGQAKSKQALLAKLGKLVLISQHDLMQQHAVAAAVIVTNGLPASNTPSNEATTFAWHMMCISTSLYVLFCLHCCCWYCLPLNLMTAAFGQLACELWHA